MGVGELKKKTQIEEEGRKNIYSTDTSPYHLEDSHSSIIDQCRCDTHSKDRRPWR